MRQFLTLLTLFLLLAGGATARQRGYVAVDEGRLYYEISGKGSTPLIFVHGHSLDRRMWREQVRFFEQHYRVIVYDARGYGRSSKQREDLRFTHCDDLVALMDALRIEKAHVVGLSMGGFIAGDLVAMYPERLLSVVLAEGHTRSTPSVNEPMTLEERAAKQRSIDELKQKGLKQYKREWMDVLMQGGSQVAKIRRPLWRMVRQWDGWQALNHETHCYYGREARRVTAQKRPAVPTLFISAHRPGKARPTASSLMEHFPNGRFEVIDDSGHMCNMEQPIDFNQKVKAFLDEINKFKM